MKVAIYARVSKDETDTTGKTYQNPENQLVPLRDWAKAMQWEVVGEYIDRASGADAGRPGFRSLLNDGMKRKYSAVIVWKLDRFSRENMSNVLAYIQNLRKRGIAVISQTESWLDTREDNPMSELVLAVMSWASAEERRKISERTKAGINRLKALGHWKGGRPRVVPPVLSVCKSVEGTRLACLACGKEWRDVRSWAAAWGTHVRALYHLKAERLGHHLDAVPDPGGQPGRAI